MRSATSYQRLDAIYIHSNAQTTCGVWLAVAPFTKLAADVSTEELGKAVEQALDASRIGIEHPSNWDTIDCPLPELAGVKSWATFMRNARCTNIKEMNEYIELTPNRNLGPSEGYEPISEAKIVLTLKSHDRIGFALLSAFENCS